MHEENRLLLCTYLSIVESRTRVYLTFPGQTLPQLELFFNDFRAGMAIRFKCKKCGKVYQVSDEKAGKRFQCRQCEAPLQVPNVTAKTAGQTKAVSPTDQAETTTARPTAPDGKRKQLLIGIGALVLLVGVAIFLMLPSGQTVAEPKGTAATAEIPAAEQTADSAVIAETESADKPAAATTTNTTADSTHAPAATGKVDEAKMLAAYYFNAKNKLKEIGLSFHNFYESNRGLVPDPKKHPEYYDENGQLKVSWRVHLLPFLGESELFKRFKLDEAWDSPANAAAAKGMPDIYRAPDAEKDSNLTRFHVFQSTNDSPAENFLSVFPRGKRIQFRDITDGMVNTVMAVDAGPEHAVIWSQPGGLDPGSPSESIGSTQSGILALFCDGHTSLLKPDIDAEIWKQLVQPADQNVIDFDSLTTDFAKPWEFGSLPTGPLHLAYLSEDCNGVFILRPKSIVESAGYESVIDSRTARFLIQVFAGNAGERVLQWELAEIETIVTWNSKLTSNWFAIRFTKPVPLETVKEKLDPFAIQHDPRTFLIAHESQLARLLPFAPKPAQNSQIQPLMTQLQSAPLDSQFAMVMLPQTILDTERIPGVASVGLGLLTFEKQLLSSSKVLELQASMDEPIVVKATIQTADTAVANQLKQQIEEQMAINLRLDAPAFVSELRKQLYPAVTVKTEQNTVQYQISKTPDLFNQIKTFYSKAKSHQEDQQKQKEADSLKEEEAKKKTDNMRKIGAGFHRFYYKNKVLPSTRSHFVNGKPGLSWRVHLLPYLGQKTLYDQFQLGEPWDSPHNMKLLNQMPDFYQCEGVTQPGHTTYMTFLGEGTPFDGSPDMTLDKISANDGLTKTIMFVKAGPDKAVPWTKPVDLPFDPVNPIKTLGQLPGDTFLAITMDGFVHTLKKDIPAETLRYLIQYNDGNKPIGF